MERTNGKQRWRLTPRIGTKFSKEETDPLKADLISKKEMSHIKSLEQVPCVRTRELASLEYKLEKILQTENWGHKVVLDFKRQNVSFGKKAKTGKRICLWDMQTKEAMFILFSHIAALSGDFITVSKTTNIRIKLLVDRCWKSHVPISPASIAWCDNVV